MLSIQSIYNLFAFSLIFPFRKANNLVIVCGVLKTFTTFVPMSRKACQDIYQDEYVYEML